MKQPLQNLEGALPVGAETLTDIGEKCGVFGIYQPDTNVAEATYHGLYMLKHRGQDASGIVVADEDPKLHLYKDLGSVKDVFQLGSLLPEVLPVVGRLAIGHNRYGTQVKVAAEQRLHAAQPIRGINNEFAGAYNGDVSNIHDVMDRHGFDRSTYASDTEGVIMLIDSYIGQKDTPDLRTALHKVLPQLEGAFCGVFTDGKQIIGARDPNGFRPFVYGRTITGGHVIASEVRALHVVGAEIEREIAPGEMMVIDDTGIHSERFADESPTPCAYEYFYFSKEDNIFHDQKVGDVRRRFGDELALEHPVQADLVVGVPNSGITAAEAYAKFLGLDYAQVINKSKSNQASGLRSFLANNQGDREAIAKAKFVMDDAEIRGKSLVVVDDSVIRGTVSRQVIHMLREAGATAVHVRVPAPVYKYSCHYGMDTGRPEELLATGRTLDEMRDYIGADSLEFLSPAGVLRAVRRSLGKVCLGCATGEYPTEVPLVLAASRQ